MNKQLITVCLVLIAAAGLCAAQTAPTKTPTKLQIALCVAQQCGQYDCGLKPDEDICLQQQDVYYHLLYNAPICVTYKQKQRSMAGSEVFPIDLWLPCRSVCYDIPDLSQTMKSFFACQDQCVNQPSTSSSNTVSSQ